MDKFRLVLEKIRTCIEMQNGATGSQLKAIWNDLSEAITENEQNTVLIKTAKEGTPKIILMASRGCSAAIINALQDIPNSIMERHGIMARPEAEPFIINRLPDIEHPPIMMPIRELEEPFYKRFDKRRGKRKNRR